MYFHKKRVFGDMLSIVALFGKDLVQPHLFIIWDRMVLENVGYFKGGEEMYRFGYEVEFMRLSFKSFQTPITKLKLQKSTSRSLTAFW